MRHSIQHGSIGPVYWDQYEVLRRIFVTVRDRNWQEIAPKQWNAITHQSRGSVDFTARHCSDLVDFEWRGSLEADVHALRFAFEGTALRSMEVCRLGLVVLHPVDSMIGSRLTTLGPQGMQQLIVSREIFPQPIVRGVPGAMTEPFSQLRIEKDEFGTLEVQFQGELFELEDQRNWGDASFKAYCTPLRLGFPRVVQEGTRIAHQVEVRFTPTTSKANGSLGTRISSGERLGSTQRTRFPSIGRHWQDAHASGPHGFAFHHVHFDVPDSGSLSEMNAVLATNPRAKIQFGLTAGDDGSLDDAQLALLRKNSERIARLLVYGRGNSLPTAAVVESLRTELQASAPLEIPLYAATRGYYVEFNRAVALEAEVDGITFPLTATVHSDDAATIVDNVEALQDMARSARRLAPQISDIAVAPLALYHPTSTSGNKFPRDLAAPWLVATLIHAALGGVASITLADDVLNAISSWRCGRASTLLQRLLRCSGLDTLPLDVALPPSMHALMLRVFAETSGSTLLAVNLAEEPAVLSLQGQPMRAGLAADSATRRALFVGGERIEVPGRGIVWADLPPSDSAGERWK
jgi:hypothetical protein